MNMPLPGWRWIAGAVALLVCLWWIDGCYEEQYQQEVGAARAAEEEAVEKRDLALAALEEYASLAAARKDSMETLDDSLVASRVRESQAEERADEAETRMAEAGASVDSTVDTLRAIVRPEVVPVVDTLDQQIAAEREAVEERDQARLAEIMELEAQVVTVSRQRDIERAGRIDAEAVAERFRQSSERWERAAEEWREAAQKSWLEEITSAAPQFLTGAALALLIGASL